MGENCVSEKFIQRPITTPSSCNLVAISSIHNRLINHANMPAVRHPCSPLVKGHPCGEELLPSVYQAALSHAGSYVRRPSSPSVLSYWWRTWPSWVIWQLGRCARCPVHR